MEDYTTAINQYLDRVKDVLSKLDENEIGAIANVLKRAYDEGRFIFVLGNGGSAATASHLAGDLNKGACFTAEKKFKVLALTDCLPMILSVANDVDYESIFVEQLKNFASPGDVVMGFSGSGNSPNVLRAIQYAKELGCPTIGICGYEGGELKPMVDYCFHVKVNDMQLAEDAHMILVHILMKLLHVGQGTC